MREGGKREACWGLTRLPVAVDEKPCAEAMRETEGISDFQTIHECYRRHQNIGALRPKYSEVKILRREQLCGY